MIAELTFTGTSGVRSPRFVPRASIPLSAACLVANGVRETLREIFGAACDVTIGEPAAVDDAAWAVLNRDAWCFLTPGRQTDIVLVVPHGDARRLVLRAFGEAGAGDDACSALELHALERIAARCAAAFDPLCAERHGVARPVSGADVPRCVAFFDIRVAAPSPLALGVGIVRDLPQPGPSATLSASALHAVPLELRAELGSGTIAAHALLDLNVGDVVRLRTKVGSPGGLKVADHWIAGGICGSIASRYAFEIRTVDAEGIGP